jgi:Na+/proline symporter
VSLAVGLLYLAVLVVIGVASARRSRTAGDYFLAGRRLGLVTAALTTMASIMSGFVFVGGPGLFYQVGLGSFWIVISSSFTGALMAWVLAKPLFRLSREGDCLTVPDIILRRFGCRVSGGLAALAILLGAVGYLATQLEALTVVLSSATTVAPGVAVLLGVGILVFYSSAGGMRAGVQTDVLQGVVMLGVAVAVLHYALQRGGGLEGLSLTFARYRPEMLSPWGTVGMVGALSWFFLFALGALGQPHVVNRFMMVRSPQVLRYFPLILAGSMIVCGMIWLGAGAAVRALVLRGELAELGRPDEAIVVFLREVAPPWLGPLAYVGIVAAIMSTADSFVNVGAAAVSRDLPKALGLRVVREVRWGRLASLGIFAAAGLLAFRWRSLVAYLGILSFAGFAAALTPILALGLNWPEAGRAAARGSLGVGLGLGVGLEALNRAGAYPFEASPGFVALAASTLAFLILGKVFSHRR